MPSTCDAASKIFTEQNRDYRFKFRSAYESPSINLSYRQKGVTYLTGSIAIQSCSAGGECVYKYIHEMDMLVIVLLHALPCQLIGGGNHNERRRLYRLNLT